MKLVTVYDIYRKKHSVSSFIYSFDVNKGKILGQLLRWLS